VVDRWKDLAHVALQDIGEAPRPGLALVQRAVGALADAVGIRMIDETAREGRLNHPAQRVMHDAVAKWGCADQAPLRFVNGEAGVLARLVGRCGEFVLKLDKVVQISA